MTGRRTLAAFEAVLFAQAFRPLAQALGFFGDVAVDAATRSLFLRDATGHPQ